MLKITFIILVLLLSAGCETEAQRLEQKAIQESWKACVDQGGVPIGAWFNSGVLSECKFPPIQL